MPHIIYRVGKVYLYSTSIPRITLVSSLSVRKRYPRNGYPEGILNRSRSNPSLRRIPWRRTYDMDQSRPIRAIEEGRKAAEDSLYVRGRGDEAYKISDEIFRGPKKP